MINTTKKVYLSIAGMDPGWIVGKIAEDIQNVLRSKGVQCRYGSPLGYGNEEICYHLGYAYAKKQKNAEINSIFITHIDDKLKENLILSFKDEFDSFVCMSKYDREFLLKLGFDPKKTFGLTLPVRNDYVRPISIGIFSGYYKDGRKNEQWLLDFIRKEPNINLINFVFIGPNWNNILNVFSEYKCSFEWHSTDRTLPYEYKFQQDKLSKLDHYFYMGMDGGAMGSYDAYAYGVPLLITNDGYHKEIPYIDNSILTKREFHEKLAEIIQRQWSKLEFFECNNAENYVTSLFEIWSCDGYTQNSGPLNTVGLLEERRHNYFPITIRRLLGSLKRRLVKDFFQ